MNRALAPLALAIALGGCNIAAFMQDVRDVGQEARDVIAQLKAGYKIVAADTDKAIVFICGKVPAAEDGMRRVAAAWPSPGPNTMKALVAAQNSLDRSAAACASYTGNGNPNVLLKLAAAFEAGTAAVIAADKAGGT